MINVAERAAPPRLINFQYEALDALRQRVKGSIRAASETTAQRLLTERNYDAIVLRLVPSLFSLEGALPSFFQTKPAEVARFSRQLATMLESGVSLLPALQLLSQLSSRGPSFRRILNHITSDLSTGVSLSQAIGKHPQVFGEIYHRTIEVGERTGRLEVVLKDLAGNIDTQAAFTKKVSGAMTYPMILLGVGLVVVVILMVFVLPNLAALFSTFKADLPLPTKILMAVSGFLKGFIVYLLAGLVALVVGFMVFFSRPRGKRFKAWLGLNLPLVGSVAVMRQLGNLARTMSLMLSAGLSLQETMDVLPRTILNPVFRETLERVRNGLFLGQGLTFPMSGERLFPPLFLQMVRVGEDSNTLDTTMRVVTDFYEAATEERVHAMVSLITPLITIFMAGFVAFVALAVIMPMYSLSGAI